MKNLKIVLKIIFQFYNCDENALKYFKKMVKNVVVFFWHFLKKWNIKDTKKMPKNAKKCQKMPNKLW